MEMLRFGDVVLDVDRALLRAQNGTEIALRPKSLDLLVTLARNPGRVISRDELFDAAWPGVTVTEGQHRPVRARGSARDRRP